MKRAVILKKELQLTFDYKSLRKEKFDDAKMCMELSGNDRMIIDDKYKNNIVTLKSGNYLSIFYPYKQDETDKFHKFKIEIEAFLKKNKLNRISDIVIEKEHPELSSFLDENTTMFELQIFVE